MRVALLAHCHHPIAEPFAGGLEAHTSMLADELVRRGHQVTLFAKAGSHSRAQVQTVVDRGTDHSDDVVDRGMTRAAAAVHAGTFDVVLNNSLNPVPYTAYPGLPMLTILHTPATLVRVNAVIEDPCWQPGDRHAFVAVSGVTAADWQRRLTSATVGCIPNGIDLDHWAPTLAPRTTKAGQRAPRAVWAARITPEKGLPTAIAAARAAGFQLEFCGPIADRDHFRDDIQPLLGADIRYLGHLDHRRLPRFLRRGDVFLSSPQWDEPFGLSMVEAMACGTPVAALPRGAAAEVVGHDGGVLAADLTVGALAQAVAEAARLDRVRVRHSVGRFAMHAMVDAYETLMLDLVRLGIRDDRISAEVA